MATWTGEIALRSIDEREEMNWDKLVVMGAQVVVFVTLAVLVALGHNSAITDGLMAVGGSITGINLMDSVARVKEKLTKRK